MSDHDHPQTDLTDDELAAQEGAFDEPECADDEPTVTVPEREDDDTEDVSYRSAVDGRYVTEETAEANPHTTVREQS